MEFRDCHNCGNAYAVAQDDQVVAYNHLSPWLENVCKRCTCRLRKYHTWTITDDGGRLCGYCFIRRIPLGRLVAWTIKRRKRDLVP